MVRDRRIIVGASLGFTAALALLGITMSHILISSNTLPFTVTSSQPMIRSPIEDTNGRPLTHLVRTSAAVLVPSDIPSHDRRLIERTFGWRQMPPRPTLVTLSRAERARLLHKKIAGLRVVQAEKWARRSSVSSGLLMWVATEDGDVGSVTERWSPRVGYQLSEESPQRTTVSVSLSSDFQGLVGSKGAAVVVNRTGNILADVQSRRAPVSNVQASVGMAEVPPMMAVALSESGVRQNLQDHDSLAQVMAAWGPKNAGVAVKDLGLTASPLWKIDLGPSISLEQSRQVVLGSGSIKVSPLAVARSYLPFIAKGRDLPLRLVPKGQHRPLGIHLNATMFDEVLGQLPMIRDGGQTFRVWRPVGNFSVVIDQDASYAVVLEGTAAHQTIPVIAMLADQSGHDLR